MTPAELKTIREAVGLSVPDLAALSGVQERTVRYWESGRAVVPDDVSERVLALDAALTRQAREAVALVREQSAAMGGMPMHITLLRYRDTDDLWRFRPDFRPLPVTTHAALLARCRAALADLHVGTSIKYMEPEQYSRWLCGRADSEATRAEWAAQEG